MNRSGRGLRQRNVRAVHAESATQPAGRFTVDTVTDVPPVDAALLARVAAGDEDAHAALRELYERHAPWLLVRLSGRCSDQGVVDEALQDTFVAVWRRADSYRGQGEVAAWLWGIAVRRLVDLLRRRPRLSL